MAYSEDEFLQLAGLQHFAFCRRQWALIHLEQQWAENLRTVEGHILHEKAHDDSSVESHGDLIIMRGLRVFSASLGVSGSCDVVEFHRSQTGVTLKGRDGLWQAYPVEYKRGEPKTKDADRLQLCCQAMCLEQMLCCTIPEAALFYNKPRRRERVELTAQLRESVTTMLEEMHALARRHYTPKVKPGTFCRACSLEDICLPKLCRGLSACAYLSKHLKEDEA